MSEQNDTDPLPYVELDRTAKAIAARLASHYGFSFQHAIGTLTEFWDLNGEPRALIALLEQNIEEVLLTKEEVVRRFRIASGLKDPVEPVDLVEMHVLATDEGRERWRVRGMSRYFKPLKTRMGRNVSASEGGKKSAEVRREKNGSAVPTNATNEGKGKKKKPMQEELPGTPPKPERALSLQQEAFKQYQIERRHVIEVENGAVFTEDLPTDRDGKPTGHPYSIPFINNSLAPILKACAPLAVGEDTGWSRLLHLWWDDAWASSRPTPFPFQALASEKVYKGFIDRLTGASVS